MNGLLAAGNSILINAMNRRWKALARHINPKMAIASMYFRYELSSSRIISDECWLYKGNGFADVIDEPRSCTNASTSILCSFFHHILYHPRHCVKFPRTFSPECSLCLLPLHLQRLRSRVLIRKFALLPGERSLLPAHRGRELHRPPKPRSPPPRILSRQKLLLF